MKYALCPNCGSNEVKYDEEQNFLPICSECAFKGLVAIDADDEFWDEYDY